MYGVSGDTSHLMRGCKGTVCDCIARNVVYLLVNKDVGYYQKMHGIGTRQIIITTSSSSSSIDRA
jgi:hypothetical protein